MREGSGGAAFFFSLLAFRGLREEPVLCVYLGK